MAEAGVRDLQRRRPLRSDRPRAPQRAPVRDAPSSVVIAEHCEDASLSEGGQMHEGLHSSSLGLAGQPARGRGGRRGPRPRAGSADRRAAPPLPPLVGRLGRAASAGPRRAGLRVTAEVTPHHLAFSDEDLVAYDTNLKVQPAAPHAPRIATRCAPGSPTARSTRSRPTTRRTRWRRRRRSSTSRRRARSDWRRRSRSVLTNLVEPGLHHAARAIEAMSSGAGPDPGRRRPRRSDRAGPRRRTWWRSIRRPTGWSSPRSRRRAGTARSSAGRCAAGWSTRCYRGRSSSPTGRRSDDAEPTRGRRSPVLEDGCARSRGRSRGEVSGRTGEAFGEAVFNTGDVGLPGGPDRPLVRRSDRRHDRRRIRATTARTARTPSPRRVHVAGFVVREASRRASSWRAERNAAGDLAGGGRRRARGHRHATADAPAPRARRDAVRRSRPRTSIPARSCGALRDAAGHGGRGPGQDASTVASRTRRATLVGPATAAHGRCSGSPRTTSG